MKVIFVLPNLTAGGAERVVTILAGGLVNQGIAVEILQMLDGKTQYKVPAGVEILNMDTRNKSRWERQRLLRDHFTQEKKRNKGLVLVPFQDSCLNNVLAAAFGLRIPVIACERNDPHRKGNGGWKRLWANIPFLLASRCVFQTADARKYYLNPIQRKGVIIPNPLVMDLNIRWHGQQSKTIMTVGRLEKQKNQKMLINAFAVVAEKYPEYVLEIYGEGALAEELREQISRMGLEKKVELCGHSAEIHRKLSEAYMFVMPSDFEGMSNALIEALAVGMPVISTDHPIGGARMLIEHEKNGLLIPVGDQEALVQEMIRVIEQPEYSETLAHNAAFIRDELRVDRIVTQWLKIFREVIKENAV